MTLCPVAIAVGCVKCPIFKICPLKSIIGDYKKPANKTAKRRTSKGQGKAKSKE